jgi:hypothetical protein
MTITDLLDGVEPDGYLLKTGHGTRIEVKKPEALLDFWRPLYSRETVEALLETHRKQVLLEAAEAYLKNDDDQLMNEYVAEWLRRMALETTGVDKGEKDETQG